MNVKRVLAIALIAMTYGGGSAQAQNVSSVQAPAEFPPASYTGRQYVDSNGCVFVRAGIDGNVTWVPRVSRNRKVICGFQPSLPGIAGQTVVAAQPAQEPVMITVEPEPAAKPAPAPAAPKPAATVSVAKSKPATKPVASTQPKVIRVTPEPQPKAQPTIVRIKPAPQPAAKPTVTTVTIATAKPAPKAETMAPRQSTCRGASAISSQYLKSSLPVRCGPQATSHVTIANGNTGHKLVRTAPVPTAIVVTTGSAQTTGYAQPAPLTRAAMAPTPQTRFVPEHVYRDQQNATQGVYIPKGYKAAWDDDRLNPMRAHQTFEGKAQMELRWTNTVPRRLVEARTGKEVRYLYPDLQYPNTSYEPQIVAGVSASATEPVSRAATAMVEQPVRRASPLASRDGMENGPAKSASKPMIAGVSATVSTRASAAKPKVQASPSSATHRYVQVGLFGDPGNAKRTAQRLANAGLPARMGSSGQYKVVVAGPFATQGQLSAALQQVRAMGFGDAYLRK